MSSDPREAPGCSTATGTPASTAPEDALAPGGPGALGRGCECSILANAGYRIGADPTPLIDPNCPLHQPATVSGSHLDDTGR